MTLIFVTQIAGDLLIVTVWKTNYNAKLYYSIYHFVYYVLLNLTMADNFIVLCTFVHDVSKLTTVLSIV